MHSRPTADRWMTNRWQTGALVAAIVAVLAFAASLVAGLIGPEPRDEPAVRTKPELPGMGERIEVQVLNGAGREDLARRVTFFLRERGFDVVAYGNAASFDYEHTLVLDRVGRLEQARAVARALGVTRVRSEPDSTLFLDVTVVLGREWRPPAPPVAPTGDGGLGGRLRRFLGEVF